KAKPELGFSDELLFVKLRYKDPDGKKSHKVAVPVRRQAAPNGGKNLGFASAIAAFGMVLRDSKHKAKADLRMVSRLARAQLGPDPDGVRHEFLQLVQLAEDVGPGEWAQAGSR
ncbi:MAG: YfbK domain-containing protein, partial [Planctomycetota bacterium]